MRPSNGCSRANVKISHNVTANDHTSLLVVNLPCKNESVNKDIDDLHGVTVQIHSDVGYDNRSKEVLKQEYMDDVMIVRYDMGMRHFNLGKYF